MKVGKLEIIPVDINITGAILLSVDEYKEYSNRFTLVTPKPENGVRLQATLGNQNPTGLPVGAVRSV